MADATLAFARASRLLDPLRLHVWEEMGITFPQLRILFLVRRDPGSDLRSLAERLDVGTSAASQQVDRLVDKGLLSRLEDPEDRRRLRISLTEKGNEAVESISAATRDYVHAIFEQFSDDQLRAVGSALASIVDAASSTPQPHLTVERRAPA
jgi:DNA-binding MarR family transcriptional regulator